MQPHSAEAQPRPACQGLQKALGRPDGLGATSETGGQVVWFTCSVTSVVSDSVTPWTGACQAPLSMGFSRQEYWNGLPFPSLGGLPNPGIKALSPVPPALRAYSLLLSHQGSLGLLQAPSNNLLNHPVLQNQWTFSSCFSLVWG